MISVCDRNRTGAASLVLTMVMGSVFMLMGSAVYFEASSARRQFTNMQNRQQVDDAGASAVEEASLLMEIQLSLSAKTIQQDPAAAMKKIPHKVRVTATNSQFKASGIRVSSVRIRHTKIKIKNTRGAGGETVSAVAVVEFSFLVTHANSGAARKRRYRVRRYIALQSAGPGVAARTRVGRRNLMASEQQL